MPEKNSDSRHLTLWLCVIIAGAVIFVAWIFAVRYNFQKISQEMQRNVNKTPSQAVAEVQEMFQGFSDVLNVQEKESTEQENQLNELKTQVEELNKKVLEKPMPIPGK